MKTLTVSKRKLTFIVTAVVGGLLFCEISAADPNPELEATRLARVVLEAGNHRLRARAAYSLEDYTGTAVREALHYALTDEHDEVRLAAISSLAKVGDPETITILRALQEKNHVLRNELHRAIVLLEEKYPEARAPIDWTKIVGVVEIVSLASAVDGRTSLVVEFRDHLTRHIRMQRGLAVVDSLDEIGGAPKRDSITPLAITGNLLALTETVTGDEIVFEAVVSVAVLSYPGKSIRFVLTNRATVRRPLKPSGMKQDPAPVSQVLDRAMMAIAEELKRRLADI